MGTMLQERGLKAGQSPEEMNLTMPEVVAGVHREYLEAGADIIVTNTFGGSRREARPLRAGREVSRDQRRAPWPLPGRLPATGPMWPPPSAPPAVSSSRSATCTFDEMVAIFREQATPLIDAGADLITLETFLDIKEIRAAVIAIREISADIPIIAQLTFDDNGRSVLGTPPEAAAITLEAVGADIIGSNCGLGVDGIYEILCGHAPRHPRSRSSPRPMPVSRCSRTARPSSPALPRR